MPGEKAPSLTVVFKPSIFFQAGPCQCSCAKNDQVCLFNKILFFHFSKHISRESTLAPALATIDLSQFINWKQFKFIIGINWMYLFVVVLKTAPLVWISSCNPTI